MIPILSVFLYRSAIAILLLLLSSGVVSIHALVTPAMLSSLSPPFSSTPWLLRQVSLLPQKKDEDDSSEEIFYDDFGGAVIGGASASSSASPSSGSNIDNSSNSPSISTSTAALKERIADIMQQDLQKDAQLAKNWRTGNWKVRGFSLDTQDLSVDVDRMEDSPPIHVAQLEMDGDKLAVARTDGSLVMIQMGTELLARFTAKLTATEEEESGSIKVESRLEKQTDEYGNEESPPLEYDLANKTPFEILMQFTPHDKTITSALLMENDILYTASGNEIRVWKLPEDEDYDDDDDDDAESKEQKKIIPVQSLTGAHQEGSSIVALKTLSLDPQMEEPNLLLSAASDGSFAIWDLQTGDLVFTCVLDDGITCADVHQNVFYLGLSTGHVVVYVAQDIVESAAMGGTCPVPNCRFLAHESGVTSLRCAGEGTVGRNRPGTRSYLLLTGGSEGMVKQWEILGSKQEQKLEHWPRLANQRMQRRAHLFKGHAQGPITALATVDSQKFLSAGSDGSIRAWSPQKGKELFRMDGFPDIVSSLCLEHDILITNGMQEFVCVHDFDVDDSEVEDGYEIEW